MWPPLMNMLCALKVFPAEFLMASSAIVSNIPFEWDGRWALTYVHSLATLLHPSQAQEIRDRYQEDLMDQYFRHKVNFDITGGLHIDTDTPMRKLLTTPENGRNIHSYIEKLGGRRVLVY